MKPLFCSDADRETTSIDCLSPIHPEAEQRLRRSSYLALQDVRCIATDDAVYLYGCLPSFYLKQVAQEIAAGVEGVHRVINRIEVLGPAAGPRSRRGFLPQETV
jgi:osmotically-inducible protein OsmY